MGKQYELYPIFEDEARLFGMPMSNFTVFILIVAVQILAPIVMGAFGIGINPIFLTLEVVFDIAFWITLKQVGKKAYPNFLFAWLSFSKFQPGKIDCSNFKINWQTIDEVLEENNESKESKDNETRKTA